MTVVGVLRPDDWNFPLLVHVLGAMLLVGTLVAAVTVLALGRGRSGDAGEATRFAFRVLLLGAVPSYVAMRVGAQWIAEREDVRDDVTWLSIGYATADAGAVVLVAATLATAVAARRSEERDSRGWLPSAALVLVSLTLVAYVVAIWAMTTKPA